MKKTFMNMMFTTGTSIIGLTLYFILIREDRVLVQTILQLFGANILIHLTLHFRYNLEIKNPILEIMTNNTIIIIILLAFGFFFNWFSTIPIWVLVVSGVGQYLLIFFITISKIRKDTEEVNKLLDKINQDN